MSRRRSWWAEQHDLTTLEGLAAAIYVHKLGDQQLGVVDGTRFISCATTRSLRLLSGPTRHEYGLVPPPSTMGLTTGPTATP